MKKIKSLLFKIVLVAAILFNGQACIDLEEDTSSILQLENLTDEGAIIAALTPIYRQYQVVVNTPHNHFMTAWGADDLTTWSAGNKAPIRVFDRFDYGNGENSDIAWLSDAWNRYWKVIYFSNSLIEGLKTSTAPSDVIVVADAEARFFRAISYFGLVKRYGNMPIILDGMEPTGKETRATVLENYQHIEADLKIAEANLPEPDAVSNIGRVSSAAAKSLYAELNMTWAGWPVKDVSKYAVAATKAKEVINLGYFELLPIDKLWLLENQNSRESIFSVQYSASEDNRNGYPAAYSHHQARGWSDAFPERQFYLDFPEGPRKDWTFYSDIPNRRVAGGVIVPNNPPSVPYLESQRRHPMYKKFTLGEDLTVNPRTISYRAKEIYRYAEVLLIYAEDSARVNGTESGETLEAYNQILRRAAGLPYDVADVSVDASTATAEEIMQEKAWEFAGELGKRWWDLVRTETVAQANENRDPTEEVSLAIDPSAINWKHYIAPIPFQALSTSDLVQNPEGFKIQ
jgi:hypothetical protein